MIIRNLNILKLKFKVKFIHVFMNIKSRIFSDREKKFSLKIICNFRKIFQIYYFFPKIKISKELFFKISFFSIFFVEMNRIMNIQ